MQKKIYVCAPLDENVPVDCKNAKIYYDYVLKKDCVPVGPHAFAVMFGVRNEADKREMHRAGMSLLWFCDEVWVFGDELTKDMQEELQFCRNMKLKTKRIRDKDLKTGG